jgi:hypothetical protein
MKITVKVQPELAPALRPGGPPSDESDRLAETLREHGASLTPLHPDTSDETLGSYFTAEVGDARADDLVRALNSSPAVEGAYVKPLDEPP